MIEQPLAKRDQRNGDRQLAKAPGRRVETEDAGEDQILEQQVGADVDRGHDEEQAQEIDPGETQP